MQNYKPTDLKELKFENSAEPILSIISADLDLFSAGAFLTAPLGDLLVESSRAPLTKAISQTVFRSAFKEIFDAFVKVGTFEAYITVFKKIFGDDVDLTFVVPAPGKLQITIEAQSSSIYDALARYVSNNTWLYDEIVDENGDNIAFQVLKGFQTQYELEQMLFEMVPGGIFTQISLTIGV